MSFDFDIRWKFRNNDNEIIDPNLFRLLFAIREKGSLRSAAEATGISYRHAWGLLKYWSENITRPLARLEKGRGASLTPVGEKMLWAEQLLSSRLQPELELVRNELNNEFSSLISTDRKNTLKINASHGLAIAYLQHLLQVSKQLDCDFHFRGSLESLRELANGKCDIAGFHIPKGEIGQRLGPVYQQWLDRDKHQLLRLVTRQQGLMLQKHNLKKINGLQSLTKRSVRFINRQQESGTRILFDELLRSSGIKPSMINGYQDEEFTHLAVAAMVASGNVDTGLGIKAAASRFKLEFIPLLEESYLLAVRNDLPERLMQTFLKIIKSSDFKNHVSKLPGYKIDSPGKVANLDKIFT